MPRLHANGYDALGVDPQAPAGADYQRAEFESASLPEQVEAVVASTSLHHVADPAHVIDRITTALTPGGRLVVVEWVWENFDEETASWCFTRLRSDDEAGWLHHRRNEWLESGLQWPNYLRDCSPYFFPDLADTTGADEQAAIDAGQIRATRIDWVGSRR